MDLDTLSHWMSVELDIQSIRALNHWMGVDLDTLSHWMSVELIFKVYAL